MRRRPGLALIAGGLALLAVGGSATPAPPPGLIGAYAWQIGDDRFGGFSAIHVADGGRRFTALSDRGAYTEGRLLRDPQGRITGVEARRMRLLRGLGTGPLRPERADSEGLAVTAAAAFVSFEGEGTARLLRYGRLDGPAANLPTPEAFRAFEENGALEALAVGPDGTLYTLPEEAAGDFPVWRFRRGAWDQPFAVPRRGGLLPVAADIGPDGRFYLLERGFHGIGGFSSRLRRFRLTEDALTAEEILVETPPGLHDNLEGLSVWRGQEGLVATMVSDDNFQFFQVTEIVEYRLPD